MSKEQQPPISDAPISLPAFGTIDPQRLVGADELFAAVWDKFPVSLGHTLIIARRAVLRFGDLTADEQVGLLQWVNHVQRHLQSTLSPKPDGFTLGINDGVAAGQTVPQFHFHVIPRHAGDIPDARGGIRWVKPDKAKYW